MGQLQVLKKTCQLCAGEHDVLQMKSCMHEDIHTQCVDETPTLEFYFQEWKF